MNPLQKSDNILSSAEKKSGWKLLFDGKSTKGWRTYKNKEVDSWEVTDGAIYCKSKATKRADLITEEKYGDFELSVDWKVSKAANSGIVWRATEEYGASYESGPEYQLIDDEGYTEKLEDWQKSGADYAMHPPLKIASKPTGQYNHTVLKVKGGHVEQYLNGEKVAEFEMWTPDWEKRKSESKWKDAKGYGMSKAGHICLQDHGGGIWFKNLKIRPL
ncbi:MAG: DUF1080 domain-containing protein [Gemmatimonadaceae bacterium]|nr:DUF1080 domain-containing protein [Chitinophagaceae bacterium]